jgi:thymidylate synthase (FAD)
MNIQLLYITNDAENFIGQCASICYDSRTDREANTKRAAHCVDKGHLATLRFASAVFNVSGISRAAANQFVRSKHLDFLQRSQRYCAEDTPTFVYPNTAHFEFIDNSYKDALVNYNTLLANGVKKEDARMVLPLGIATELNVVGNFQAWLDFLKLRTDKAAQAEIREVAVRIGHRLAESCPNIFKEYRYDPST